VSNTSNLSFDLFAIVEIKAVPQESLEKRSNDSDNDFWLKVALSSPEALPARIRSVSRVRNAPISLSTYTRNSRSLQNIVEMLPAIKHKFGVFDRLTGQALS